MTDIRKEMIFSGMWERSFVCSAVSDDIAGRVGGDEFLVFVKDVTDKEILDRRMTQLFERLRSANSAPCPAAQASA